MAPESLLSLACACASLRRTGRAVTQLYETELQGTGLRITQFTLLQALEQMGGAASQGALGELLALDATTLSRTLPPLERAGWIRAAAGRDRREVRWSLTPAGRRRLARAQPAWERAQGRLRAELPAKHWKTVDRGSSRRRGGGAARSRNPSRSVIVRCVPEGVLSSCRPSKGDPMSRRVAVSAMLAAAGLFTASSVSGQQTPLEPKGVEVFNRSVSSFTDGTRTGLRLSASAGVAYLAGIEFGNGTIEFDVKGKDVQGQSFVGVAFHGVDGTTYDAIYFRSFNFRTEDPARRLRAVQYISHPAYPWPRLRAEHPGQYEKPVSPAPDPNGWFHVRVVVAVPSVSVFVADAKQPSLVVSQLSDRGKGRVGLWVGNGSDGDFANVKIVPKGYP